MPSLYKEKQSREFLNQMEGYLTSLEDELMDFRDVEYKNFTKKEEEIIDLFYFKFQDIPLLSRMEAVAENFIDEVETLRDNDMDEEERAIVMEKFMNMYETQDLYVIYSRFLESCGYPGRSPCTASGAKASVRGCLSGTLHEVPTFFARPVTMVSSTW